MPFPLLSLHAFRTTCTIHFRTQTALHGRVNHVRSMLDKNESSF